MLEALNLSKSYGDQVALEPLTLRVEPGEIFCLLGANGAGKSTTIHLFLNLIPPSGGSARVDGVDVVERPEEARRRVAYVPESVMLYGNLSGLENLNYFLGLEGRSLSQRELLAHLQQAGLAADAAGKRVKTYSKGMRQKVAIAIALAKRAKALLLDEPTSGLDPKSSNEFHALIRKIAGDGVAVLMATHDIFRARETGNRVGIMKHGRLVETLATGEISHEDLEKIYLRHMHD